MKKAVVAFVFACLPFLGITAARADQINMHASACQAQGNGMLNVYPQTTMISGLNSAATLLCPVPISPTGTSKVLYVDGKNLVTNPTPVSCTVYRYGYNSMFLGSATKTAPATAQSWELVFSLSGTMQPATWDYFVLQCTVNNTNYGGLLGYTVSN